MLPFQTNPSGQSATGSALSQPVSYVGGFRFGKNTISWGGKTVLRQNISSVYIYNIERTFRISQLQMVLLGLGILLSYFLGQLGLIIAIPFGLLLAFGILERMKKQLYGVTMEMNSGSHKNIYSSDEIGIEQLYNAISESLESDTRVFEARFENGAIKIENMHNINNEIHNSPGARVNNFSTDNSSNGPITNRVEQLSNALAQRGIEQADIEALKAILATEQPNHANKVIGPRADSWITQMVLKYHNSSIAKDITSGLLVNILSHYFGWS